MIIRGATENYTKKHVSSIIMPDTLYHFTPELKWLLNMLRDKKLFPRYCEEDTSYLKIRELKSVAIPMSCFCDIAISKLGYHMDWYGNYGIAFPKAWGIEKGLQQVQYINEKSALCHDMKQAIKTVFKGFENEHDTSEKNLQNYVFHELMYYKPYQGQMKKRTTGKVEKKCLADECEWRYIPQVSKLKMPQITFHKFDLLDGYSDTLSKYDALALTFDYSDIKHIVIRDLADYQIMINDMEQWNLNREEKYTILSRIMVWDDTREDL